MEYLEDIENGFRCVSKCGAYFTYNKSTKKYTPERNSFVLHLKCMNVKGAHPDDGHVDRERNIVHFVYPFFLDSDLNIGDLICLGRPYKYQIVRVIKIFESVIHPSFQFEPWFIKQKRIKLQERNLKLRYLLRKIKRLWMKEN